ncbi:uncharacterized protein EKO05_0006968 [Ascochyta rabiei]|nr:uncharacterized protein EKO05_0006968 [Ascochyta rabiei]UPX16576.1 hypothetical protein EKO05_0006968 [Ascochyta rabiei]
MASSSSKRTRYCKHTSDPPMLTYYLAPCAYHNLARCVDMLIAVLEC